MSNQLAIATVTAALGRIVLNAASGAVSGSGFGQPDRSFGRPPTPANGQDAGQPRINIFLYHVAPHGGLRNADLPTRGSDGALAARPRAALILDYLISFYGDDKTFLPERMLAAVARDLHARPLLTAEAIRDTIDADADQKLGDSDLADAVERVNFTATSLSLEDMSRLWSVMIQTPYALSLTYQASVVLIDALETASGALPVLGRGADDRGPEASAAAIPQIESLWIGLPGAESMRPRPPSLRSAQLGATLLVAGVNLGGDVLAFLFAHARPPGLDGGGNPLPPPQRLTPESVGPDRYRIVLPDSAGDQANWAPGLYTLTVEVERSGRTLRSAAWPLMLAPRVVGIAPDPVNAGAATATLTVTCRPQVLPDQAARLLVSGLELVAVPHPTATAALDFEVDDPGDRLVDGDLAILRVDGADSQPFLVDAGGRLAFDDAQRIKVQ